MFVKTITLTQSIRAGANLKSHGIFGQGYEESDVFEKRANFKETIGSTHIGTCQEHVLEAAKIHRAYSLFAMSIFCN